MPSEAFPIAPRPSPTATPTSVARMLLPTDCTLYVDAGVLPASCRSGPRARGWRAGTGCPSTPGRRGPHAAADLWSHHSLGVMKQIRVKVPPHGCRLLLLEHKQP